MVQSLINKQLEKKLFDLKIAIQKLEESRTVLQKQVKEDKEAVKEFKAQRKMWQTNNKIKIVSQQIEVLNVAWKEF